MPHQIHGESEEKLESADRDYGALSDVTDVCGVRITTYFADDVDRIADMIECEFNVDVENSVDKSAQLDPDQFVYLSRHYVGTLSESRLELTEYLRFSECQVEIQIRSILQHAWAEIEHDLGYKSEPAVPREIRRRFSRIAGLLEIADTEFAQIRDELRHYEATVPARIAESPDTVPIDQASLGAFVEGSV